MSSVPMIAQGATLAVVSAAVDPEVCSRWLAMVDDAYQRFAARPSGELVVESSSFRLRAVETPHAVDVWSSLSERARRQCLALAGAPLAVDIDQCWVRRQHAPHAAPLRHRPHSWHQDGALGVDFGHVDTAAPDALLPMVTCWIALTSCGIDSPALDLVTDRVDHLLVPSELADGAVERRWPASQRLRPLLAAGDALVFNGAVVHRTHLAPTMRRTRTSIELRCFHADAIPARLAGDQFVAVP